MYMSCICHVQLGRSNLPPESFWGLRWPEFLTSQRGRRWNRAPGFRNEWNRHLGYESIPMKIPFLMGWTSIYQLFWCELQGYKVLTHCHIFSNWKVWKFPTRHVHAQISWNITRSKRTTMKKTKTRKLIIKRQRWQYHDMSNPSM
jgi:hypothetical protein